MVMMTVARNHFSGSYNASKMEPEELISYRESLTDLKANSKPHINMLTMLAEESFQQGSAVVRAIEDHILQVFTPCLDDMNYQNDNFFTDFEMNIFGLFLVCNLPRSDNNKNRNFFVVDKISEVQNNNVSTLRLDQRVRLFEWGKK